MVSLFRKRLLTLVAALVATALVAGCGESLTGPAGFSRTALQVNAPASGHQEVVIAAVVTAVTDPDSLLGGSVTVGEPMVGWMLYDETVIDQDKKPDRGKYLCDAAPSALELTLAGFRFRSDPAAPALTIRLVNADPADNQRDSARAISTVNLDLIPGVGVASIGILLMDTDAHALASDQLFGTDPFAGEWPTKRQVTITGTDGWQIVAEMGDPSAGESDPGSGGFNKREFHRE